MQRKIVSNGMQRDGRDDHLEFALPGARPQYGPDKIVDVEHIDLHLTPHFDTESLDGICTLTVRAIDRPVSRLVLDAVDLEILKVEPSSAFRAADGKLSIDLATPIAAGESASIAVTYRADKPRHGLFFIKPTADHPEKVTHVWTQSQDQYARFWFPCFDFPSEKQSTSTTIVVPKGNFALGNGALVERRDEGEQTIFRYRQDVPHSTYLVTMVAGPFVEIAQGEAGRNRAPVFYQVLPGRESEGERSFGKTPQMIDLFERKLGTPYPYARYSQIAVSDFIFGGMENTSATTQTDRTLHDDIAALDFSSDPLVSHELAHQWFGDLLTCRDWAHAWLNEGFATYMEAVWREADLGADEYLYDIFECVKAYLHEESQRYSRPIVCNMFRDPIEIFDRHLYQKGGAVLHMLRGELGEERFWRSIARYVADNAQRSVETIDLIRAIEAATGRNMRQFFSQWVFREGHPKLQVTFAWDSERHTATVTVDQQQTVDAEHPAYAFEVDLGFAPEVSARTTGAARDLVPNERRVRAKIERAHETIAIPLDFEPHLVRFDPGAFILGDVRYRLGVQHAAATLQGDPDLVARIRAARELAADGGAQARAALSAAFAEEAFWGVLVEAATAAGATKAPWARDMLIAALQHKNPRVVRGVARALGEFRDADAAAALIETARTHRSYFVRAAALLALGKTRDARAFDVLRRASEGTSWNQTVEAGAVLGLAELADERVVPLLTKAAEPQKGETLRRAAVMALARVGALVQEERTRVVDELERRLDDSSFLVAIDAINSAESLGDPRLLPALDRLAVTANDGRTRRDAMEAAIRIRKGEKVPAQMRGLRENIDELREDQRRLQAKIEALERS
jgi:aminopeptidase N